MNLLDRMRGLEPRKQMLLMALTWILLACVLWLWWDERTLPDLRGTWTSERCEEVAVRGGVSRMRRTYVFTDAHWRLDLRFYEDDGCTRESYGLDIEGPYELGPKRMVPRTATEARFGIERIRLTPRDTAAAASFAKSSCGVEPWVVGQGQDISRTGCFGVIPSVDACPAEYDIVTVAGGKLRFGDRSEGMCDPEYVPGRYGPFAVIKTL